MNQIGAGNGKRGSEMISVRVQKAKDEAVRFINAVINLQMEEKDSTTYYGSKLSGAVRRASLDLTRALAEMRKPG